MVWDTEMKKFWSSAFRRKALDLVRWRAVRSFSSLNFRPAQTGWSCSKCICISGKKNNNKSVAKDKKKSRATKSVSQHIILRHRFFSLHDHAKHVPPNGEVGTPKKGPTCSLTLARVSSSATQKSQVGKSQLARPSLIGWFEGSPANHMLLDNIHWALLCPVTPQLCRGISRKPPWLVSINSLLCTHDASRTLHSRYHIITDHNINDKETCSKKFRRTSLQWCEANK